MANTTASIITIGDELLIGQTIDTNSAWIAKQLNSIGVDIIKRVAVGDEKDAITRALDMAIAEAGIVLITGGLGPTADDITKPLLCDYFYGKLIVNEEVLQHVKAIFAKRNRPFLERNMKQAEVPDTCKVLFNPMGTAPGMMFEKNGSIIIAMPGVPFEMMAIMETAVMPMLKERIVSDAIIHKTTITAGEGESFIAEKIQGIEMALPSHIKLAYLPSLGLVKLRLTAKGADAEGLDAEVAQWQQRIVQRLHDIVVATEDISFEQITGNLLKEKKATLCLAESCTGGYISHLITQVAGSSSYYKGGIVSYLIEIKENLLGVSEDSIVQNGAVSEVVANQMARGALQLLKADYSLSITGILDKEPVAGEIAEPGTVWMAVSDGQQTIAKKFRFFHDRQRNKESAATMGMLMLWKFINGKLTI
jgi:nicotinamide-nucleotide amidase